MSTCLHVYISDLFFALPTGYSEPTPGAPEIAPRCCTPLPQLVKRKPRKDPAERFCALPMRSWRRSAMALGTPSSTWHYTLQIIGIHGDLTIKNGEVLCWGRKKHPNKHGLYHVSGCESPLQRPGADRMILLMESLFCSPNSRHIPLGWYIYIYTHISC